MNWITNLQSSGLRALAATSLERSRFVPALPTMVESGFPGYEVTVLFGAFAPAGRWKKGKKEKREKRGQARISVKAPND